MFGLVFISQSHTCTKPNCELLYSRYMASEDYWSPQLSLNIFLRFWTDLVLHVVQAKLVLLPDVVQLLLINFHLFSFETFLNFIQLYHFPTFLCSSFSSSSLPLLSIGKNRPVFFEQHQLPVAQQPFPKTTQFVLDFIQELTGFGFGSIQEGLSYNLRNLLSCRVSFHMACSHILCYILCTTWQIMCV